MLNFEGLWYLEFEFPALSHKLFCIAIQGSFQISFDQGWWKTIKHVQNELFVSKEGAVNSNPWCKASNILGSENNWQQIVETSQLSLVASKKLKYSRYSEHSTIQKSKWQFQIDAI